MCQLLQRNTSSPAVNSIPLWLVGITQGHDGSAHKGLFLGETCSGEGVLVWLPPALARAHQGPTMGHSPAGEVSAPMQVLRGQQLLQEYSIHHGVHAPPPTSVSPLLFLTLISSSFFSVWCCLSFLKYVFPEVPPAWLKGSAVPCHGSVVQLARASCGWHRAAPGLLP